MAGGSPGLPNIATMNAHSAPANGSRAYLLSCTSPLCVTGERVAGRETVALDGRDGVGSAPRTKKPPDLAKGRRLGSSAGIRTQADQRIGSRRHAKPLATSHPSTSRARCWNDKAREAVTPGRLLKSGFHRVLPTSLQAEPGCCVVTFNGSCRSRGIPLHSAVAILTASCCGVQATANRPSRNLHTVVHPVG